MLDMLDIVDMLSYGASWVTQLVKNLWAMQALVQFVGQDVPLKKG